MYINAYLLRIRLFTDRLIKEYVYIPLNHGGAGGGRIKFFMMHCDIFWRVG